MSSKYKKYIFPVGIMAALLIGVGTVQAVKLTKKEEIQLKQEMKQEIPVGERNIDLIGIFPPGFSKDVDTAFSDYEKEYGKDKTQKILYKNFTILVPPTKLNEIPATKVDIDLQVAAQAANVPSASVQDSQKKMIREAFGTTGEIVYNSLLAAYTDEDGFQYNFEKGELVNKQVGATNDLGEKFIAAYPYFKEGASLPTLRLTEEQAKVSANRVLEKVFSKEKAVELEHAVDILSLGELRLGLTYGNDEVKILVDKVTGNIIHFSKVK
ncbi:MAG: hypothetical protein ABIO72_05155 [Patescibacteria group bacterium]